jgi:Tol biopolymer transport system component
MGRKLCSHGACHKTQEAQQASRQRFALLTVETLAVECVTNNNSAERSPAWSPDGTRITYMCRNQINNGVEICVMNADGTGQTQLTDNSVLDATSGFSPDGEKIVWGQGQTGQAQLWLMKADDGTDKTQLVIPPGPPGLHSGANLAPSWGQLWVGGRDPQ